MLYRYFTKCGDYKVFNYSEVMYYELSEIEDVEEEKENEKTTSSYDLGTGEAVTKKVKSKKEKKEIEIGLVIYLNNGMELIVEGKQEIISLLRVLDYDVDTYNQAEEIYNKVLEIKSKV